MPKKKIRRWSRRSRKSGDKKLYVVRFYEPSYGWTWTKEKTRKQAIKERDKIRKEGFRAFLRRVQ